MEKRSPALVEQPAADQDDRDAGNHSQNGNDLFRDDVARKQQRAESQQEDADGVGEGDGRAQQSGVLHIAAGSDQVGGDDGLAVARFQGVHRAQPERDGDSRQQPSGAQLRLVQELGQIICVHTSSYLVLAAALRSLADFLEVSFYKRLKHQRNFVAMNLAAGLGVRGLAVGPRRLERLLGWTDLDHHFAGHGGGAFPQDLADLAHGFQRLGVFGGLFAVLGSGAAGAFLRRGLARLAVGLGVVGILLIAALLAVGIGLGARVLAVLLLAFVAFVGLLALVVGLVLGVLLLLLLRGVGLHLVQHVGQSVLDFVENTAFAGICPAYPDCRLPCLCRRRPCRLSSRPYRSACRPCRRLCPYPACRRRRHSGRPLYRRPPWRCRRPWDLPRRWNPGHSEDPRVADRWRWIARRDCRDRTGPASGSRRLAWFFASCCGGGPKKES